MRIGHRNYDYNSKMISNVGMNLWLTCGKDKDCMYNWQWMAKLSFTKNHKDNTSLNPKMK